MTPYGRYGHRHAQSDGHVRTLGGDGIYTPRRKASGGTSPAHTWTSSLQDREE